MTSTWIAPRVWIAGERVTASKMNEISTDFNALFPHTAGGDLAYRDPAGAYLAALAKGAAYQSLRMNSGATIPEWGGAIVGKAVRSTNQSISNSTFTLPIFTSEEISHSLVAWSGATPTRLTIGLTGIYLIGGTYAFDGGSGYREANIYKNGAEIISSRIDNAAGETTSLPFGGIPFALTAGDYLEMLVKHNAGSAINLRAASLFAAFLGV